MRRLYPFVQFLVASSMLPGCALDARGQKTWDEQVGISQSDSASDIDTQAGASTGVERDAMPNPSTPDAGVTDASLPGAEAPNLTDDAAVDAAWPSLPPRTAHVTDGVTTEGEWERATWSYQGFESDWGQDRNTLSSLAVEVDSDFVWLRVEGKVEFANAIAVYFDSVAGAGLSPSDLTDRLGTVDDAISCGIVSPKEHAPDFAWGTRVTDGDGALIGAPGFRELSAASDLSWIDDKLAPSVCKGSVCEARISRELLHCGGPLFVFARLVNGTGDLMSNQILPFQPDGPSVELSEVLEVRPTLED